MKKIKTTNLLKKLFSVFMLALSLMVISPTMVKANAASVSGQDIVNYAKKYLGTPYVYGGTSPNPGFDCSGFTQYVYRNCAGIDITRTTYSQINYGSAISYSNLQPGDLVFTYGGDHVGIFVGNDQYIHSPQPGEVVKIGKITSFYAARRVPGLSNSSSYNYASIAGLTFDAKFYADKYDDLKKAFGYDTTKLYNHFLTYGIKEGRCASPLFDVKYYLSNHIDLVNAFGKTNYTKAYNHFLTYGYKEGRKLSPVFDAGYYLKNNGDVAKAFGTNYYQILNHFREYGMKEGRQGSANFNMQNYKARYADLQKAYGSNNVAYYKHYLIYGINEGRNGQ